MIDDLSWEITYEIGRLQEDIPRNPGLVPLLQSRIALLQSPTLKTEIVNGQFWAVDTSVSTVPVSTVFLQASMRSDATMTVGKTARALPVLAEFFAQPFPKPYVRIWYGFSIGSSGGSGELDLEDKATYEGRMTPTTVPWEPVIYHELAHSYILHEGLNQFLEVYTHNLLQTGSADPARWTWVRGAQFNTFTAALEIYRLIGLDAMKQAYRTIYTLKPPYGTVLSDECKQAFVKVAPESLKPQVSALASTMTY